MKVLLVTRDGHDVITHLPGFKRLPSVRYPLVPDGQAFAEKSPLDDSPTERKYSFYGTIDVYREEE